MAGGATTINGLPATVIVGQGNTHQGTVGIWNAFVEMEDRVYSFLGLAPAQVFTQLRPTFESVAGSFSPLRDSTLVNIQPARLKVVRADRSGPFASFLPPPICTGASSRPKSTSCMSRTTATA